MSRDRLVTAMMILSVVCAVTVTGAVVRQTFFPSKSLAAQPGSGPTKQVADWKQYATAGHAVGRPDAAATLVVFSDYQCPACRMFSHVLDSLNAAFPDDLRIVWRHMPLAALHPFAREAAVASECAAQQGRFDEYGRALFKQQSQIGAKSWTLFAVDAGVKDTAALGRCVANAETAATVVADSVASDHLEVRATPTLLLNNTMYTGGMAFARMSRLLKETIATTKK